MSQSALNAEANTGFFAPTNGFLRNYLLNPRFQFGRRGTSFSTPASGLVTLDRWLVAYDGTIGAFTLSRQAFTIGQTAVPNNPLFFLRWNQTGAGSGSSFRSVEQRIQNVNSLSGQQVVLTLWAKADSARTVTVSPRQYFGSGGSPSTEVTVVPSSGASLSLTSSWQKFTCVFTLPSVSGKTIGSNVDSAVRILFLLPINATMTIDVADVQVEDTVETPFEIRPYYVEAQRLDFFCQSITTYVGATAGPLTYRSEMFAAPTISGGGSGFATSGLTTSGGSISQTSGAVQTLLLEAELT